MGDTIFFSGTGGANGTPAFFDPAHHPAASIPADAVKITRKRHLALIDGQSIGGVIAAGPDGQPVLQTAPRTVAHRRAEVVARIKAEAAARIRAVATIERQTNDNAQLAAAALQIASSGGTSIDTAAALDRRARIDALRARSNTLEAEVSRMTATDLAAFTPSADTNWEPR